MWKNSLTRSGSTSFRPAQPSDIPRITEIYEAIHTSEESGRATIGWARGVYPTESTALSACSRGELFVEEAEGIIVGSAVLNHMQMECYGRGSWALSCAGAEILVMHTLTIDPAHSGRGYGNAFAAFYEERARETGCKALRIDTQARNAVARAMYKKRGFREVGTVPCEFNGILNVQLVLLEKTL